AVIAAGAGMRESIWAVGGVGCGARRVPARSRGWVSVRWGAHNGCAATLRAGGKRSSEIRLGWLLAHLVGAHRALASENARQRPLDCRVGLDEFGDPYRQVSSKREQKKQYTAVREPIRKECEAGERSEPAYES